MPRACLSAALLILLVGGLASAATRVPLVIDEPHETRDVAWPVTTGVPFPKGALAHEENCRLVDDRGNERPLQSRVTATWDAEAKSIRWLTIDFLAEPGRSYHLEFGPEVTRRDFPSSLNIDVGRGGATVLTGPLRIEFSKSEKAVLGAIAVDLNSDGRFGDDETVAAGAAEGDRWYVDQDGKKFSSAGDGGERQIVVEQEGPVRACVRVDGFYSGPDGKRIVAYRTRYHLFAGLPVVKVIDEFRIFGTTKETRFTDIALALDLKLARENRIVTVDASGRDGNQPVSARWSETTSAVSSYQTTYRHLGNPEHDAAVVEINTQGERRLSETPRIGEWMQAADDRACVTGSLRWMWQQFPKEWETKDDQLILHLWSPRGGELDFGSDGIKRFFGEGGRKYLLEWDGVRGTLSPISNFFYFAGRDALARGDADGRGVRKHHEVWLHFGPASKRDEGAEYGSLAAKQPLALATGEWNCGTGVFGPLAARPNDSPYEAIVDRLFDLGRYGQDTFGDYGWWQFGAGPHYSYQWDEQARRHYADPRRFEYHTYQKETQLWWNYLRSGERKFYDWAFPSENHWVSIAVSHEPLMYHTLWRGGEREEAKLHWPRGDWAIDSPLYHVRHHDNAEAWLRGGSQYWASYHRTLETTTLAYYLTGDERYNDVIGYWREYFGDLAGKTNASPELKPWHREQKWFVPLREGERPQTWAEMIRDYAPFTSGSRHQQTLFFNLATLYEHTWDPQVGRALRDYADAFLEPDGPIGAWRSQENRLPAHAEAPKLAHYWAPALWKYARASGDPRMKEILNRYYGRMWLADPFREDVGIYSNQQIGWAYWFTRDPRHLRPALLELNELFPNAAPLAKPQDINTRLYNPYAPIRSFAAVPRLIWALEEAKRTGVAIPPLAPLKPQRTTIAIQKQSGKRLHFHLWGYDRDVVILGPDGEKVADVAVKTTLAASDLQPFDRVLPDFEVYLHEVSLPGEAPAGYYALAPHLEMAVLDAEGAGAVVCSAVQPISIDPGEACLLQRPAGDDTLVLESAAAASLLVTDRAGSELGPIKGFKGNGAAAAFSLVGKPAGEPLTIKNMGPRQIWFRVVESGAAKSSPAWVTFQDHLPDALPSGKLAALATPHAPLAIDVDSTFVPGRFGKGVLITDSRKLHLPDHIVVGGEKKKLFDTRQGTIEFWVKRQWDERLQAVRPVTFVDNGLVKGWSPWRLPLREWAHVAVVWRPLVRDPDEIIVHVYVDGLDQAFYRSTHWEGYGNRPFGLPRNAKWLEEFLCTATPGASYVIDELRVSSTPRYADLDVKFGGQQTFNPYRFTTSDKQPEEDADTLLLFHFDGDLKSERIESGATLEGRLEMLPKK